MKRSKKTISIIAAATMICVLATACSGKTAEAPTETPSNNSPIPSNNATTTYPIQTDKMLTYWSPLTTGVSGVKATHEEVPFFQEWQKRTGVDLKFIAPPASQVNEAFNVMLASGELPDMIEYNWMAYPGGPEKAIKDGQILRLNDLINEHAPNLKKYLNEHPEIDKMVKTDSGSYYAFPFIRGDEFLLVFQGPIVRKDWLDELGLPVPETIDDWTEMLKAFKEKKGAAAPLTFRSKPRVFTDLNSGGFVGAFGTTRDFYLEDGQIKFGPIEQGFKDFLSLFHSWYAQGLLDKNIATIDSKALDAAMTSGAAGATVWNTGGGIGKWQPILSEKDAKAELVAAPYPVLNKGDKPKFGQLDNPYTGNGSVAITTKAKDPVLAVKMLDYAYGEEGHMLSNFGIEDVSYKMVDGYPKYTDLVMNNPDKLTPSQVMSLYFRASYSGPFVQDKRYMEQYAGTPAQFDAITIWQQTDMAQYKLPPLNPTPEESSEFAKIMTDVNTLVDEMTLKIILGAEPVDNFEKYAERIKSLKIDRAIEIQKAALDRYNSR